MSKMHFRCPCCGQKLAVNLELFPVDTKLKCKKCLGIFAFITKKLPSSKQEEFDSMLSTILSNPIEQEED